MRWRWLLELFAVVVLLEILLAGYHFYAQHELIWTRSIAVQERPLNADLATGFHEGLKLSPYMGYAMDFGPNGPIVPGADQLAAPITAPPDRCGDQEACQQLEHFLGINWFPGFDPPWHYNACGFHSYYPCPYAPPDNALIVGVFGNSIAEGYALWAFDPRSRVLKYLSERTGRRVVVLNFTIGGAKQPTQLLALAYALSIGQHFDLILNMDGFNEIYVGWLNVNRYGVVPSMPYAKLIIERENLFADEAARSQEATTLLSRRDKFAGYAARTRSIILYYVFRIMRDHYIATLAEFERNLSESRKNLQYPVELVPQHGDFSFSPIVDLWVNSSISMAAMARAHGAAYIHVLQPNQYYSVRHFTDQEIGEFNVLGEGDAPLRTIIPQGYEAFRAQANKLTDAGVDFVDATGVFEKVRRTVYFDWCCHVNEPGQVILDDFLHDYIVAALEKRPIAPSPKVGVSLTALKATERQFDIERVAALQAMVASAAKSAEADPEQSIKKLNDVVGAANTTYAHGVSDAIQPLVDAYLELARIYVHRNDKASAIANFQSANAAVATVVAAKPGDRQLLTRQIDVALEAATGFVTTGNMVDAKASYQTAAAVAERLLISDPDNVRLENDKKAAAEGLRKLE